MDVGLKIEEGESAKGGGKVCKPTKDSAIQIGATNDSTNGATVSFHDVSYEVKMKKSSKCILHKVCGIFPPGMNAILGPTGSGKTTLLDILASRKNPHRVSGCVLFDGNQPINVKCTAGYVVQEDILMGTLTVRESLAFSAAVRLPSSVSRREKRQRVLDVITELGLTDCADTKIGTSFIPGISGGEKKRATIGMELIIQPKILFLDEPSTGLDASTAKYVMNQLKTLSERGRTIIFSIHQPRYAIYRLFDTLFLLSKGETAYHGPAGDESLEYFQSIGYQCEEHNNPSDFFLDVIDQNSALQNSAVYTNHALVDETEVGNSNHNNHISMNSTSPTSKTNGSVLNGNGTSPTSKTNGSLLNGNGTTKPSPQNKSIVEHFRSSNRYRDLKMKCGNILKTCGRKMVATETRDGRGRDETYPTSFPVQLFYVSRRSLLNFGRNPLTIIFMPFNALILALLIGAIYWKQDMALSSGIQNRTGAFLFITLNIIFSNLGAVDIFMLERTIYRHEASSGFYRPSAYFLAKVFCDLIPFRLIPALMFSVVSYWMIGFKNDVESFFIYMLVLVLASMCACCYAFVISLTIATYSVVILLVSSTFVIMLVFSGLLVNITSLPIWLQWIQYLSIMRYSLNALYVNELSGLEFCGIKDNITICESGEAYMDEQGVDYTPWGMWHNLLALLCMTVGLLILTYVQLRRSTRHKS